MKRLWMYLALIVGAGLIFFSPFIFSDQLLVQSDQLNGIDGRMWFGEIVKETHSFPLWWPTRLGGVPTLDATFGDHLYPLILCQFIFPWYKALGWKMVLTVIIAGLTAFLLFRRGYRFSRELSLLLAVLYMFNTNFVSHLFPGHDGKMYVISLMPFALFALKMLLDELKLAWMAVLGLAVGLSLYSGHVQLTYMMLWGLFCFFVFHTVTGWMADKNVNRTLRKIALFTSAITLGLGISMVQWYPPMDYVKHFSVRGTGEKTTYEHATSWSLHPEEVASLVVPEFGHFSDKDGEKAQYWGRNPFKLNSEYPGLLALLFGILGVVLFRKKNREILFWGIGSLVVLVYALGANTPFFHIFYQLVPGVKTFRAPSMIMCWFALALIIMTGITITHFLEEYQAWSPEKKAKYRKSLLIAAGSCLGFALLCTGGQSIIKSLWSGLVFTKMPPQNAQIFDLNYPSFIQGCWINMALAAAALFLTTLVIQNKLTVTNYLLALGVLGLADLWRMDANFFKLADRDEYVRADQAVEWIKKDTSLFRVFDANRAYSDNSWGIHHLQSVNGFLDNELACYREFRGGQNSENFLYRLAQNSVDDNPFLNLLNVKYIVYKTGNPRQPTGLLPNKGCLPRAFIAGGYRTVDTSQTLSLLKDPSFPYRSTVILNENPPDFIPTQSDTTSAGTASIIKYTPNRISFQAELTRPGFLVLGDNYFPAWQALVDGKKEKVLEAYGCLRAVPLTAGKHEVTMYFSSAPLNRAAKVAGVSWIVLLGIFGGSMAMGRKRKDQSQDK